MTEEMYGKAKKFLETYRMISETAVFPSVRAYAAQKHNELLAAARKAQDTGDETELTEFLKSLEGISGD